jgi:hypothetical protein
MSFFVIPQSWIHNIYQLWDLVYKNNPQALNLRWMEVTKRLSWVTDWPIAAKRSGFHIKHSYIVLGNLTRGFTLVFDSNDTFVSSITHNTEYNEFEIAALLEKMKRIGMLSEAVSVRKPANAIDLHQFFMRNLHSLEASIDPNRSHYFTRDIGNVDEKLLGSAIDEYDKKRKTKLVVNNENDTCIIQRTGMTTPIAVFNANRAHVQLGSYGAINLLSVPMLFGTQGCIYPSNFDLGSLHYKNPGLFAISDIWIHTFVRNPSENFLQLLKLITTAYSFSLDFTHSAMVVANSDFLKKMTEKQTLDLYAECSAFFGQIGQ